MDLNKDNIERLFDHLKGEFDVEEPRFGHKQRLLDKLDNAEGKHSRRSGGQNHWKLLSIAASIALVIAVSLGIFNKQSSNALPPEVQKTQFYFASMISLEMDKINNEVTPDTQKIVDDALIQMKKLEENYEQLEKNLQNQGDSKQILNAMIINFQTRIELLQSVLEQIENVKKLKNNSGDTAMHQA